MKIKRTDRVYKPQQRSFFNGFRSRKKMLSQMDSLKQERHHLLVNNNDFYIHEAYKSLRTNVLFSLAGEEESSVVQVTSSMPSEGKSTTSTNLAISFAGMGKKTLLIDCDMRKPKLARLLNLKSKTGLSNVLLDPQLRSEAIISTKVENLEIMTAGDIPPNPSELLGSHRMVDLIKSLREEYDFIVLDTPPVNVVTDAVILGHVSDGTLMVVRSGQSERGAVCRAVDQLDRTHTKLLGFVLNGVNQHVGHYGAYRKNGYYQQDAGYGYSNSSL